MEKKLFGISKQECKKLFEIFWKLQMFFFLNFLNNVQKFYWMLFVMMPQIYKSKSCRAAEFSKFCKFSLGSDFSVDSISGDLHFILKFFFFSWLHFFSFFSVYKTSHSTRLSFISALLKPKHIHYEAKMRKGWAHCLMCECHWIWWNFWTCWNMLNKERSKRAVLFTEPANKSQNTLFGLLLVNTIALIKAEPWMLWLLGLWSSNNMKEFNVMKIIK